jgi:nucleotide-binding universal stress UspA family protein
MDNMERIGVLVGVDGSDCGWQALDWAAAEAAARQTALRVVHVLTGWPTPVPAEVRAVAEKAAQATVDTAVDRARRAAPDVSVHGRRVSGEPVAQLLQLAADAEQVVVGSRGRGGFAALLLGSVGADVAAHAKSSVVVVRGTLPADGPVIVGVDGSTRGEAALEYAFAHAARRDLPVRAVHVYQPYYPGIGPYPGVPVDAEMVREDAEQLTRETVGRWAAKYPDVPLESRVISGGTAHHLIEESETGSLLVVGSRGHGGFAGLLLGSVSQAVVRHAHCPVAIAR